MRIRLRLKHVPEAATNHNPDFLINIPGTMWIHHLAKKHEIGPNIENPDATIDEEGLLADHPNSLTFSMESPMYTDFYEHTPVGYKHQMLFDGGTVRMTMPTNFEPLELAPKWEDRKRMCAFSAPKFWWMQQANFEKETWRNAVYHSLQEQRLRDFYVEAKKGDFDLYGPGWENLQQEHLPPWFPRDMALVLRSAHKGTSPYGDKLKQLSQYKYAICYENTSLPGYITEKPIDCIAAGTLPIYKGPPGFFINPWEDSKEPPKDHTPQGFADKIDKLLFG